jgi:hypothetical protein
MIVLSNDVYVIDWDGCMKFDLYDTETGDYVETFHSYECLDNTDEALEFLEFLS